MTRFKIDRENNITAFGSSEQIEDSGGETEIFASRQELAALAEKWPATRLVEIWNSLPGIEPVERFTSQQAAISRICRFSPWTSTIRKPKGPSLPTLQGSVVSPWTGTPRAMPRRNRSVT